MKFRDDALAMARRDGIAMAFSLNLLDGGMQGGDATGCPLSLTGGPGLLYDATGACKMTAAQVRNWAEVLGQAGCAVAAALAKAPARACSRA